MQILLEQEQRELLSSLVEADRNVPRNQRERFLVLQGLGSTQSEISHPGLPGDGIEAYEGGIEALVHEGLLKASYDQIGIETFDVTPLGFRYYEELKKQSGQPVNRVQTAIRDYLTTDHFRKKYPAAYQKWADAEVILWATDSERQLTTIGHLCREAIQEFAATLVAKYQPPNIEQDKAKVVARIKSILNLGQSQFGNAEKAFLDALLAYWGTVSDLIQRQEHDSQKEGQRLVWEDGRRVVFQTAIVMFEIDRSLSRIS